MTSSVTDTRMSGATGSGATGTTSGADELIRALRLLGVETVFGLPGVHNLAIWEAAASGGLRVVGVRHEQTAVYAADGYARATGRLGVAVVTTGPGAANTLGVTGEAGASGSPVLVVATDIPSTLRRPGVYRGVLHETRDQAAMFAPVTKTTVVSRAAGDLAADTLRAASVALQPATGPVYLGIPTDFLSAPVEPSPDVSAPPPPAVAPVADSDVARALGMLASARRPLVWAGGGALRSGAGAALGEFARRLGAPVITTFNGRGVLPPDHPCLAPGPPHVPPVGRLWDDADLVIAVGSDLDGMTTQNWLMPPPPALLAVNVDAADAGKNYPADQVLVGDATAVLSRLLEDLPDSGDLEALRARLAAVAEEVAALVAEDEPQAATLLAAFDRIAPSTGALFVDMCIPGYWLAGFSRVPGPRRLAYPMGWGTLGFAFPAAVGAACAGQERTVAVVGDGGFLFACGELATVAQERLPLTVVVVDDGGYGMLRYDQRRAGVPSRGVDLVTPDFRAMAEAFGVPARSVTGLGSDLAAVLAEAVAEPGPNVVVVDAALTPPPSTSPRWYRRGRDGS